MNHIIAGKYSLNLEEILFIEETSIPNPNVHIRITPENTFVNEKENEEVPDRIPICTIWFKVVDGTAPFSKEFYGISRADIFRTSSRQMIF